MWRHGVEAIDARQLDKLVQIAIVQLEALLVALILYIIEVLLVPEVVQGAEYEVVLRHGIDTLGPCGVVIALAQLQTQGHVDTLRGLLQRLYILMRLLLRQREAVRAYLHRLRHAEVTVVGEADLREPALLRHLRHLGHPVLRVKGTGAVYMVIS